MCASTWYSHNISGFNAGTLSTYRKAYRLYSLSLDEIVEYKYLDRLRFVLDIRS